MYYTYVLQSMTDKNFYIGFTRNLKLRFEQHNKGLVKTVLNKGRLLLVYHEACVDRGYTMNREKYFKTYNGKENLIKWLKSYLTG